jgi:ketosteroid isomerase-like protein
MPANTANHPTSMRPVIYLLACLLLAPAAGMASDPPPQLTAEECTVWQREQSFARSVADHDAEAFAEHVGENAAFNASTREPIRGREAIAKRWAGLIEGKRARLRWYPIRVTMAPGVEDIAWSSGPSLIEVLDPQAKDKYLTGAFHSVWHRDADRIWRVLFDDGVEPRPATAEEVAAFEAGRADCGNPNRS